MNSRILQAGWLGLVMLAACGGERTESKSSSVQSEEMKGMEGMEGMEGMPGMTGAGDSLLRIAPDAAARSGLQYAVAREGPAVTTVRASAQVVPNERGLTEVNARVSGWVERLWVNETGRFVRRGDSLLALYAPELLAAQEELLLARTLAATPDGATMVADARRRLELWNVSPQEIAAIEREGVPRRRVNVVAPRDGHVIAKLVVEGEMVAAGEPLFRLADLSTVWIEPAIHEQDLAAIRIGQTATVAVRAYPGLVLTGRVSFIPPTLDSITRTVRVRVEVANPGYRLKTAMFATVTFRVDGPRGVLVPLAAVLPTGTRNLAFVVRDGGIRPVEVQVGLRGDTEVLVSHGLAVGDTVVSRATFLLDSESSLAAAMKGIMLNMGMGLDMGGMQMEEKTPEKTP